MCESVGEVPAEALRAEQDYNRNRNGWYREWRSLSSGAYFSAAFGHFDVIARQSSTVDIMVPS